MNYVVDATKDTADAASGCMVPSLKASFQPEGAYSFHPTITRLERIGQATKLDGSTVVLYVVDQDGTTYSYLLTLTSSGLLEDIE